MDKHLLNFIYQNAATIDYLDNALTTVDTRDYPHDSIILGVHCEVVTMEMGSFMHVNSWTSLKAVAGCSSAVEMQHWAGKQLAQIPMEVGDWVFIATNRGMELARLVERTNNGEDWQVYHEIYGQIHWPTHKIYHQFYQFE
jgi:hypothetical protein